MNIPGFGGEVCGNWEFSLLTFIMKFRFFSSPFWTRLPASSFKVLGATKKRTFGGKAFP